MNSEYFEKIAPDISKAAGILARRFTSLEYEDIHQDLWVYVMERKSPFLLAEENGTPVNYLVMNGSRICGQRLAGANPRPDDFYYNAGSVRALIEGGALHYSDSGDVDGRSDLVEAMAALTGSERVTIMRALVDADPTYRERDSGRKKAAQRALDQLVYQMNRIGESRAGWHEERATTGYPGSRKFVDQTSSDY